MRVCSGAAASAAAVRVTRPPNVYVSVAIRSILANTAIPESQTMRVKTVTAGPLIEEIQSGFGVLREQGIIGRAAHEEEGGGEIVNGFPVTKANLRMLKEQVGGPIGTIVLDPCHNGEQILTAE